MKTNSSDHRGQCNLSFTVNGRTVEVRVLPMERLLDVLRHTLGLTGAKEGCGEGECGSCAILMNGELVNSCLIPALQAADANLTTIEGLAAGPQLSALQQAFLECGGESAGAQQLQERTTIECHDGTPPVRKFLNARRRSCYRRFVAKLLCPVKIDHHGNEKTPTSFHR